MSNDIKSFDDLAQEIVYLNKSAQFQAKQIQLLQAKNYSIVRRNIFLVKCNRALYILVIVLLLYILIKFVVG